MESFNIYNFLSHTEPISPRGTDKARVIQVIETTALKGKGTPDDPATPFKQYWDFDGHLLAEGID